MASEKKHAEAAVDELTKANVLVKEIIGILEAKEEGIGKKRPQGIDNSRNSGYSGNSNKKPKVT